MNIKQKEFASMCGVKPPAISDLLKRGILHSVERKIDLDDPANMAYLQKHNPKSAQEILGGVASPSSDVRSAPETPTGMRGPKAKREKPKTTPPLMTKKLNEINAEDARFLSATDIPAPGIQRPAGYVMSYEDEVVSKRAFYEAEKIKNDAALKALELDKRNGTLVELDVVMEYMVKLSSAIQKGFLDVIPKQSLMICSRLGTVGREAEVEDLLADDNSRRIQDVKHIVEEMAKVKWGIKNRHVIKTDGDGEIDEGNDE